MSVHQMLGGGAAADLFLWENKRTSTFALVLATLVWLVFEIMENRFLPFVCSTLLVSMLLIFLWANFGPLILKQRPPSPEKIKIPKSLYRTLSSKTNELLITLYEISQGNDIKSFLLTKFYLVLVAFVGSYVKFLTLLYISFICLGTIPILYLKHQRRIDNLIDRIVEHKNMLLAAFKYKVLDKIPRAAKAKENM